MLAMGEGCTGTPCINGTFPANLKLNCKVNWSRQASPKGIQVQLLKNVKKGFISLRKCFLSVFWLNVKDEVEAGVRTSVSNISS